ncbi:MAG: glutamate racemase, partial [Alphaproteobacteria bacterium]|nr:glutamate racemase [Alphaproteobacteria bacterium]
KCLLLGCTHYPVLKDVIAKVAGDAIVLVDSAETAARAAIKLLAENDLNANRRENGPPQFLVTAAPDRFARVGEIFFGQAIDPGCVSLVDLQ